MARVDIKELATRYAHFGLYTTSAGGDEPIVVRRKMGEPTDYLHRNSRKVSRQRVNLALASQHWSHLTPTQKGYYRNQMDYVEVLGSPTEDKLLKGRQLFISREIRELNVAQKQLTTPFEVCIILVDEAYNPLRGKMWLFWQANEEAPWEWIEGDQLLNGNFLFRNVKPGQFVYHPYGECEGYYDPETTWLTQDELRRYHYHILLDRYYRLVLKEPWGITLAPPPFERIILEPWTHKPPFPPLEQVILEPWTGIPVPPMELVITEPWTGGLLPPEFGLVIAEPWTGGLLPPEFGLVIAEPWTGGLLPPEFGLVIAEPWTGGLLPPEFGLVIAEPWTGVLETGFEQYTIPSTGLVSYAGTFWCAQTFLVHQPHKITQVRLLVSKRTDHPLNPPEPTIASIRNTDASGKPTGADLCVGSINTGDFPDYPTFEWRTITFDVGLNLTQGKLYGIVIRAPATVHRYEKWLRLGATSPGYPDGKKGYSWDSGVNWTMSDPDFNFQEWGILL